MTWHRRFLQGVWFGIVVFGSTVAYAFIRLGRFPTYGSPDPKELGLPVPLRVFVYLSLGLMAYSVVLLFGSTLYRMFSAERRLSVREWILTAVGMALGLGLLHFADWWTD